MAIKLRYKSWSLAQTDFPTSIIEQVIFCAFRNVYLCEKRVINQLTIVKDIELSIKIQNHKSVSFNAIDLTTVP